MDRRNKIGKASGPSSSIRVKSPDELIQSFNDEMESRAERRNVVSLRPNIISLRNLKILREQRRRRPKHVSIGPLHWGDPNLKMMEDHKWRLIEASGSSFFHNLEVCFKNLKDLEDRARKSYSGTIDMPSEKFVVMSLLDAFFIIDRMAVGEGVVSIKEDGRMVVHMDDDERKSFASTTSTNLLPEDNFSRRMKSHPMFNFDDLTLNDIDMDLIMLDNQLPFFVIEYVWNWLQKDSHLDLVRGYDLLWLLRRYFDVANCGKSPGDFLHLLHFLHCSMIPQYPQKRPTSARKHWIPSATELKEAGIDFRRNKSPYSFLDIKFEDGVIKIPKIVITEAQRLKLQNFVDFEQSIPEITTHFSNFVGFISCLLSNEKDVSVINLEGIIENRLGSDKEVQQFFHNLQQRCYYWHDGTFLDDVLLKIYNYQQSKRKRWKASFRRKYCSNPWVTLSVIGAILLFILSFLQTFFAMYSYLHPST